MTIIDIHAHIHMRGKPLAEQEEELLRDMKRFSIEKRMVSAVGGDGSQTQNRYIEDLVKRYPQQIMGCAVINPKEADALSETRRVAENPAFKAVEFNSLEDSYYPDIYPGIDEILSIFEEKKLMIKVFTGIGSRAMPQQWAGHAGRHPGLHFVILHMACFDYGYGCVDLAKEYPNMYLETSNQYEVQILKKAVEQLMPEKLLFGSCYPERLTKCSIDIFDMFHVNREFREKVYYENARRLLDPNEQEGKKL